MARGGVSGGRPHGPKQRVDRCGVCGGTGFHELPRLVPWPLVECTGCGVVRLYERVPAEMAAHLYAAYYPGEDPAEDPDPVELARQLRNPTFRHRSRRLEARCPPRMRSLLEIGCGDGNFLAHLRGRGWEVEGTEIDPGTAEMARRRHRLAVHVAGLDGVPAVDGGRRAVAAYHVLEHVYDPAAWLREVRELLRPYGVLHLQVPNWDSLTRRATGAAWTSFAFPQHVYFYTPLTLTALLERSGFEVESRTTWDPWHGPGTLAGSLAASFRRPPPPEGEVQAAGTAAPPGHRRGLLRRAARGALDLAAAPLARAEALVGRGAVVDLVARRS